MPRAGAMAPQPARREYDSALNPRHSWFFVKRVCQQQNGAAEKQCVEEKVQRNHALWARRGASGIGIGR